MRACVERCKAANRQLLNEDWNAACEASRLDLVRCLQSAVDGPLAYPNFAVPFRIAVDGCQDPGGVGVTLEQVQPDGKIRVVGYASRALTRTQMKWDVSRIEAWALIFGLRTFRWALNPNVPHVLVTDHWALKYLRDCKKDETPSHRQLVRFALEIESYGPYTIEHRPGVRNGAPDGLSRLVATDISVDGRRSPSDGQPTNLWEDCLFVGCDPNVVADAAADLLRDDPAWADWQPVGNMRDVMHSALVAQVHARQACALPPQVLETLNVVCEAENPESAWPSGFRIGGITALLPESPLVIPVPLESTAEAILEALVMADVGVRDNFPGLL